MFKTFIMGITVKQRIPPMDAMYINASCSAKHVKTFQNMNTNYRMGECGEELDEVKNDQNKHKQQHV